MKIDPAEDILKCHAMVAFALPAKMIHPFLDRAEAGVQPAPCQHYHAPQSIGGRADVLVAVGFGEMDDLGQYPIGLVHLFVGQIGVGQQKFGIEGVHQLRR